MPAWDYSVREVINFHDMLMAILISAIANLSNSEVVP
jgi:hypothetical protein